MAFYFENRYRERLGNILTADSRFVTAKGELWLLLLIACKLLSGALHTKGLGRNIKGFDRNSFSLKRVIMRLYFRPKPSLSEPKLRRKGQVIY
jgi:hypothetical protein